LISSFQDTLFPYALKNCQAYLTDNWESDEVKSVVVGLRKLANDDVTAKIKAAVEIESETADKEVQIASIVKNVEWQMSLDRKTGPLKTLQGLVWLQGYKDKVIQGQ
jgi:enolase-phosphatase E1